MSNMPAAEDNQPSPPKALFSGYTVTNPWTTYRILDPVRAAALQAAVQALPYVTWRDRETMGVDSVLRIAEDFERWLASTDEAAN